MLLFTKISPSQIISCVSVRLTGRWRWGWDRSRTRRLPPPPDTDRWALGGTAGRSAGSGTRTPPGGGCTAPACRLWLKCFYASPEGKIHCDSSESVSSSSHFDSDIKKENKTVILSLSFFQNQFCDCTKSCAGHHFVVLLEMCFLFLYSTYKVSSSLQ